MLLPRLRPWTEAADPREGLAPLPDPFEAPPWAGWQLLLPEPVTVLPEAPPAVAPAAPDRAAQTEPRVDTAGQTAPEVQAAPDAGTSPAAILAAETPAEGPAPAPVADAPPAPSLPDLAPPAMPEAFDFPFDALAEMFAALEEIAAGLAGVQQALDALPPPPAGSDIVLPVLAELSPLG